MQHFYHSSQTTLLSNGDDAPTKKIGGSLEAALSAQPVYAKKEQKTHF